MNQNLKKEQENPFGQIPAHEIRSDNVVHLPKLDNNRQRCKYPDCQGKLCSKGLTKWVYITHT